MLDEPFEVHAVLHAALRAPSGVGKLCEPCVWKRMEHSASDMVAALGARGYRTHEQMAAYVLAEGMWSGRPRLPFGPLIVVTAAGRRPDWAVDDPPSAAAALLARYASPADQVRIEWEALGDVPDVVPDGWFRKKETTRVGVIDRGVLVGWASDYVDYSVERGGPHRWALVSDRGASINIVPPAVIGSRHVLVYQPTYWSKGLGAMFRRFEAGDERSGNTEAIGKHLCRILGTNSGARRS